MNTTNRDKEKRGQILSYISNACAVFVLGISMSALLAACGGGDGHTGSTLSGKVIDGYIGGAKVCLSTVVTNSLSCDSSISSASAVTDSSGNYSFSLPSGTSMSGRYVIAQIAAGNTDADATSGQVQAPYSMVAPAGTPSVVSPLTTMVSANMMIYPASSVAAAQASVASSVGVPAGSLALDYIANNNGGYHNVAKLVAAILTTAGATPTINQANVSALFAAANSGASAALIATTPTQLNAAIATAQATYSASGGGAGTATFATAFNSNTGLTTDGGTLGTYNFGPTSGGAYSGGGGASSAYWYGGYNFSSPPTTDGIGIFVAAPGVIANGTDSGNGLVVSGATSLVIPLAVDQNILTSKGGSMSVKIIAQGKVNKYPGNCTVQVTGNQTISSATMTIYTIPLTTLTLAQSCSQTGITTVASALADGVAEIHVQAIGAANLNTSVQILNGNVVTSGGAYPSGLTFGSPIQFTAPSSSGGGTGSLALRPLPSVYASNVKAINYSGYRTAGGPTTGEIPTDAQITQDLQLLTDAGYTLLRLFDTDISHENILRVASTNPNFSNLKFQLGIYLQGIATANQSTCTMPANDTDVQNGIREANTYSNVVSVSVGNETSFFSAYMPVHCLAGYITTVKHGITQPVTADDDYTFYAGLDGSTELPDTILPLLDFVSIHTYPMSNPTRWNYAGTGSATAMMAAALTNAQSNYSQVKTYITAHGASASLPIVIGETGWKHVQTNTANPLETCCANPVNAKMYYDALNTWQAAATGPVSIFYFEAFDEPWKGTDDGWGLWDINRVPLYAMCGVAAVPTAPACTSSVYSGATFAAGSTALAAPTTAATASSHTIVKSILTTSGADLSGTNLCPNWGQATQCTPLTVGGVETEEYSSLTFEGIALAGITNISSATHVHCDVWSNMTSLGLNLINSAAATGGAAVQFQVNSILTTGWNSVDIPLTSFTGVDLTKVDQLMFVGVTPTSGGTIYIQNLYFW